MPIAVLLQSNSGVSATNALVAFYDIHRGKRDVLSFYFLPDTTRDNQDTITIKTIIEVSAVKFFGKSRFPLGVVNDLEKYPYVRLIFFHLSRPHFS
jgi:hypothetical protein